MLYNKSVVLYFTGVCINNHLNNNIFNCLIATMWWCVIVQFDDMLGVVQCSGIVMTCMW